MIEKIKDSIQEQKQEKATNHHEIVSRVNRTTYEALKSAGINIDEIINSLVDTWCKSYLKALETVKSI